MREIRILVTFEGVSGRKGHEGTSGDLYAPSFIWLLMAWVCSLCEGVFYFSKSFNKYTEL